MIIVISKRSNWEEFSAALRLAHVLNVYHALDAEIITEDIALTWNRIGSWPVGNVVFIGTASSTFAKEMLEPATVRTGVRIRDSTVYIGTRKFDKMGQGMLFHFFPALFARVSWGWYYDRGTIFAPASDR